MCIARLTRDALFGADVCLNRDNRALAIFGILAGSLNRLEPPSGDVDLAAVLAERSGRDEAETCTSAGDCHSQNEALR